MGATIASHVQRLLEHAQDLPAASERAYVYASQSYLQNVLKQLHGVSKNHPAVRRCQM